jgi:hypothetical protein
VSPTAPPPTTTTEPGSTTTTTIVDQLPPGFLEDVLEAADVAQPASRIGNADIEPGTTTEG